MMEKEKPMTYCTLCYYSHTQGYRHIYTNKHKRKANDACMKMKSKVDSLVSSLQLPEFEKAASFTELQTTIWCYACKETVLLHSCEDGEVVTKNYAAFIHFLCESHKKAVSNFLTENRLLKRKDKTQYWINTPTAERIVPQDCKRLQSVGAKQKWAANPASANLPNSDQVESSHETKGNDKQVVGPSDKEFQQHLESVKLRECNLLEKCAFSTAAVEAPDIIPLTRNDMEQTVSTTRQIQPYKRVRKM
ncbi:uncharacterized protein [Watersipora subatra]|uniref:uncharacterized protein isoform X2 n=1 Tax=Watersipora subatra TaxID=2589382 RepID=UPI00355B7D58